MCAVLCAVCVLCVLCVFTVHIVYVSICRAPVLVALALIEGGLKYEDTVALIRA